ncbi:MAG: phosphoribosylaminoimidazolesuccinocarboxamide synthase [Candidatus Omnitrophica bacterium]|nr:phosphoribosylaminoimidazolesuccinocarboxamide synthase [Candidatus Omnitrophota bacterium]
MTVSDTVQGTQLPGVTLFKRGKVRDVYDLGEHLLIVATDRVSAFDVVIPTPIPHKGAVLTALSAFWFRMMKDLVSGHLVSADADEIVRRYPVLKPSRELLAGRSMLVIKAQVVPVECVVRGYLAGSGWKEYQKSQAVCGVPLPKGLQEASELPEPVFTPATKEESGHDINISEAQMAERVGAQLTAMLKALSLSIYKKARDYARSKGIIIADTKFEFGRKGEAVLLVDEVLTPDSSRFWPADRYTPGSSPVSFDKQFVRDYLEGLKWDKKPPAPALPEEIVRKTSEKYLQALKQLTGASLV